MTKLTLLIIVILHCTIFTIYSQSLDSTYIDVPCYGFPGYTDTAFVNPIPGATLYCWETELNAINGLLINGIISPVCTTTPQVNITFVLAQPFYILCVTAYSANDSSNLSCDTIWGTPLLEFLPTNSPVATPNSSGQYGISFICGQNSQISTLYWSVTGDIGINGTGDTVLTTNNTINNITLDFGPTFSIGTLCVYGVTSFGLQVPFICMDIETPVGLQNQNTELISFYHDDLNKKLVIEYIPSNNRKQSVLIYDISGKMIKAKTIKSMSGENIHSINTAELSTGVYTVILKDGIQMHTKQFIISH